MNFNIDKIRIFFGILTKEQKELKRKRQALITNGIQELRRLAELEAEEDNERDRKWTQEYNTTCPNCRSTALVNKIANVHGSGNVSGNMFGVYGSSYTETGSVKHCNNCGNQWKPFSESDEKTGNDIIGYWEYKFRKSYEKDDNWPEGTEDLIKKLQHVPAESIYQECCRVQEYYAHTPLWFFQSIFKSVETILSSTENKRQV